MSKIYSPKNLYGSYVMRIMYLFLFSLIAGCASDPWKTIQIKEQPDMVCYTGSVAGYSIYIWDCHEGEHKVVYQWSAEYGRNPAKLVKSKCGELTEFEKQLKFENGTSDKCRSDREPNKWNGE